MKMGFRNCLTVYFLFLYGICYAQNPSPGGVEGIQVWLKPIIQNGHTVWIDGNGRLLVMPSGDTLSWLNYQPVITPTQSRAFRLPLTPAKLPALTIFSVSDTRIPTEQCIWSLGQGEQGLLINTNYRAADLTGNYFFNYPADRITGPVIQSYFQHNLDTNQNSYLLWLGSRPAQPTIPVEPYSGKLGEWMLFDRVLTPSERQRIDSYLAIKYGLTLDQSTPKNYLNAEGEVIWDARSMLDYSHRIAGIGRDDKSGLNSRQATSSLMPGLPVVSVGRLQSSNAENHRTLTDRSFFIWGDDDGPVLWETANQNGMDKLKRTWRGQWTGEDAGTESIIFYWDPELLPPPNPGNQYWVVVDTTGNAQFTPEGWWANPLELKSQKLLGSTMPHPQNDAKWAFTLLQAPAFFAKTWWKAPPCPDNNEAAYGEIAVRLMGGKSPYRMVLEQDGKKLIETRVYEHLWSDSTLKPGIYWLKVTDSEGRSYQQQLLLTQNLWQNESTLEATYTLSRHTLILRPDPVSPEADYTWIQPDGSQHIGNSLSVTSPGDYLLLTREAGCLTEESFRVLQAENRAKPIELYPNLIAPGGAFRLIWEEEGKANLQIVTSTGQVVYRQDLLKPGTYRIQPGINRPGWFVVSIRQGEQELVSKLIVQ